MSRLTTLWAVRLDEFAKCEETDPKAEVCEERTKARESKEELRMFQGDDDGRTRE
jgi:hypothetical protein